MLDVFAWMKARATLVIGIVAVLAAFSAGFALQGLIKDGEIADIQLEHERQVAEAYAARNVALERARSTEQKASQDIANLSTQYVEDRQHEQAITQHRIADLAAGNERLRVALETTAAGSGLPEAAAGPSGGDGPATAVIARAVAARLEQRYADYNELVDQLTLCQGVVRADRAMYDRATTP